MPQFTHYIPNTNPDPLDFAPPLLRLQEDAPNPLGRRILWSLIILLFALILCSIFGRLDVVAIAEGKLIPKSYLKIVQPAEAGIVKEILVHEGETVRAGQVLMRMDTLIADADAKVIEADYQRKRLTLRRIDAELNGKSFQVESSDIQVLAGEIEAQYRANRAALDAALAEERTRLEKSRQELAVARQVKEKLVATLPHYREQDESFEKLAKQGYVSSIMASDKRRERIEKEQELATQSYVIKSAQASIAQSEKRLVQIDSDYRRQLYAERNETQGVVDKLAQEVAKQTHRQELQDLKASQNSVVKDLATHTIGTVVQPGTVLLTLVPQDDLLRAEVWVSNDDIGFVREGLPVKLKFAAFPFQKYGLIDGTVEYVSADAVDGEGGANGNGPADPHMAYKALVALNSKQIELNGGTFPLSAGMQTNAEILLGSRSVFEYLLSPVQKAWHEAARER